VAGSAILPRMKNRGPVDDGSETSLADPSPEAIPELPAWKAFVVQFSRDTGTKPGVLSGRVEHLSSGRRARFNTPEELLMSFERLLEALRK
jgi:hypothetical protein